MTWNERVCGQEEGRDNTTVPPKGQGNFSPSDEGPCPYTALRHPNWLRDLHKPWTISAEKYMFSKMCTQV